MRTTGFFAGALCALSSFFSSVIQAETSFSCAGYDAPVTHVGAAAKALISSRQALPSIGTINVLVVFAKFRDEAPGNDRAPAFADDLFDPDLPGSFTNFYHTMSSGQLQVHGTVRPKRYAADGPARTYLAKKHNGRDHYGSFVREILRKVDADVDLALFDNDGPDGLPNSGDDDGQVDYVFINLLEVPDRFLRDSATGIAGLGGMEGYYSETDFAVNGEPIYIDNGKSRGTILQEGNFAQTVGTMAHEFGHGLGLPDLYDKAYGNPAEDSAGIGRWGLMGWGASGWNGHDGPNPFCAWSLEQLGWIGPNNERLVEVREDARGLVVDDVFQQGVVYKIPLRNEFTNTDGQTEFTYVDGQYVYYTQEYLLLEQRVSTSNHYNRNQPEDGLLIWHIRPWDKHAKDNDQEKRKLVDLVCADGLYRDKGYPLGRISDPYGGRDNLDFWAHDEIYARKYGGNEGDATDPFDGVTYTDFEAGSNPSTDVGKGLPGTSTGLAIRNMHRQGDAMIVDVAQPRWAGSIREEVHWAGDILVDGDLLIEPEGKLIIHPGTRVRFAGTDRLQGNLDPQRCEVHVQGKLVIGLQQVTRRYRMGTKIIKPAAEPVIFEALVPGETWYGIQVAESARIAKQSGTFELRDAQLGLVEPGVRSAPPASQRSQKARESRAQPSNPEAGSFALAEEGSGARSTSPPPEVPTAVEETAAVPAKFQLLNFPNPFNLETTIRFALPRAATVRLQVYNVLGQEVRTLVDGFQEMGVQAVVWDGRDWSGQEVSSGVYFYRLEVAGKYVEGRRMLLAK